MWKSLAHISLCVNSPPAFREHPERSVHPVENASASSEKRGRRRAQAGTDLKGFANHRRLEFLDLLGKKPEMSVGEISLAMEIELKTASEHLRRLTIAGLILKRHEGREVRDALTPSARNVLIFLRMLA
jgi:DNA-binding transcriptional ArsR family regulator